MTLIVGIKCKDGIVMGADGAATFGPHGQPTIRQSVKNKIRRLGADQGMVGVSGHVGLGQRIIGEIEGLRNAGQFKGSSFQVMTTIRKAIWGHIEVEMQIARAAAQAAGAGALQAVMSSTLAAVLLNAKEPCLFQFDYMAMPEQATDDLPFVAIGSGQLIAEPFLAFLRRIYWPNKLPTVDEGVFAAVWTIQHAILTHHGGVGPPIQVVTLRESDGWKAKEMPEARWQELLGHIESIEKELTLIPGKLDQAKAAKPPPAPPKPSE
jgi:20S proteasome alpha/beta subunit